MTPSVQTRERVDRLQEALNTAVQVNCPIRHYFAPGLFAREITIPAGTCIVGAVHKTENLAILSKGRLRLLADGGVIDVTAPFILTVKPGQKNVAYAIESSVWTNFFPNADNETDIDKLVTRLSESTASELLGGVNNKQLAANHAAQLEQ